MRTLIWLAMERGAGQFRRREHWEIAQERELRFHQFEYRHSAAALVFTRLTAPDAEPPFLFPASGKSSYD